MSIEARIERVHEALKNLLGVEALSCTFDASGNLLTVEGISYKDERGEWKWRELTPEEKAKVKTWLKEAGLA